MCVFRGRCDLEHVAIARMVCGPGEEEEKKMSSIRLPQLLERSSQAHIITVLKLELCTVFRETISIRTSRDR